MPGLYLIKINPCTEVGRYNIFFWGNVTGFIVWVTDGCNTVCSVSCLYSSRIRYWWNHRLKPAGRGPTYACRSQPLAQPRRSRAGPFHSQNDPPGAG